MLLTPLPTGGECPASAVNNPGSKATFMSSKKPLAMLVNL